MSGLVSFNRKNNSLLGSSISDFHNVLDDFFTTNWFQGRNLTADTFKIDVEENEENYLIYAELPGVNKDEISLDLNEKRLTISVNREENVEDQQKSYIHRERRISSMSRSIYLADVSEKDIKAKLENGILTVSVPKQEKIDTTVKINID